MTLSIELIYKLFLFGNFIIFLFCFFLGERACGPNSTRSNPSRPKTTRPKFTRPNSTRPNSTRPNFTRKKMEVLLGKVLDFLLQKIPYWHALLMFALNLIENVEFHPIVKFFTKNKRLKFKWIMVR